MDQTISLDPLKSHTALLVIDQQYDFEPGGTLPVEKGDEIVSGISELMNKFKTIIVSQDSHPPGHISFASSYPGKRPYDVLKITDLDQENFQSHFSKEVIRRYLENIPENKQVLWPDHCVVGSQGWRLDERLPLYRADLILRKGTRLESDSYSTFKENDGHLTGLEGYLRSRKIETLYIVGLAGDFCVNWSAQDAARLGFNVIYDLTLTRFVNPKNKQGIVKELKSLGILIKEL